MSKGGGGSRGELCHPCFYILLPQDPPEESHWRSLWGTLPFWEHPRAVSAGGALDQAQGDVQEGEHWVPCVY